MRDIVGIDLGTTNCAVSYIDESSDPQGAPPAIKTFEIPQLTGPGEISKLSVLPSFLYLPGEHELAQGGVDSAWAVDKQAFAGAFARDQGIKVPKRVLASAKSWLCHDKVDRNAPILPWGADEQMEKRSPIDATAAYLRHIKRAWNMGGNEGRPRLEDQTLILTVPASFDQVARDLTMEAASRAGLARVTLLEEPLAAFYCWLYHHDQWSRFVHPGDLILVCDVGGGTTDFTLITVQEQDDRPVFERIAVGDHLMLGGDNMDLALAHECEARLKGAKQRRLSMGRWQSLCSQCRQAKEAILNRATDAQTITVVGEGQHLIGDTVSTTLSRDVVASRILDGFFPLINPGETVSRLPRRGMAEFGLPYAQDPAVTRHLIRFLEQHGPDVARHLRRDTAEPDWILFNGAALRPAAIQERIREAVGGWFNQASQDVAQVLVNPDISLAVAAGAAYYGMVKKGAGVPVASGSPRAYYLSVGVKGAAAEENMGEGALEKAVCLVPRGMAEGTQSTLKDRRFRVLANQPVRFYVYSASYRTGDRMGDVVDIDDTLTALPPLHTVIKFGKKVKERSIPVEVEVHYTETGTLALWCRSIQSPHRWRFQFQLRQAAQTRFADTSVGDPAVFEESRVEEVLEVMRQGLSANAGEPGILRLAKSIASVVDRPKAQWPLSLIRRMADELLTLKSDRKRSAGHEARWLNLMGFCMRPGFGDPVDDHRLQNLWKLFHPGPVFAKQSQVRSEWWVMWRRVAGGLPANQQHIVVQAVSSLIRPKKGAGKSRIGAQEHMEVWMAMANLERISAGEKEAWGRMLLKSLKPKKTRPQYWWSLSRIAAREPLYGPLDRVVPADVVADWINRILSVHWPNPQPVGAALAQMARLTGDRKRDLDPEVIRQILDWIGPYDWSAPYARLLEEVVPITRQEEGLIFGESLPSGIQLKVD